MGNSCWGESSAAKHSAKIDESLDQENLDASRIPTVKMLLLGIGTGDSGKSTFLKQMRVLHKDGFSQQDLAKFSFVLPQNCLDAMRNLVEGYLVACTLKKNMRVRSKMQEHFAVVTEAQTLNDTAAESIVQLWRMKEMVELYHDRTLYNINVPSSAPYYFKHTLRFAQEDYIPTVEDVLHAKVKTTGATETVFFTGGVEFRLVDVGGQRSERRKWLHCFEGVSFAIYLAALDEYDMTLEEDSKTNRLEESLRLFSQVTGSQFFEGTTWILFLNKFDLFQEKLRRLPLPKSFKDAPSRRKLDDAEYEKKSLEYLTNKYINNFRGPGFLYHWTTTNIDTKATEKLFGALLDTILQDAIEERSGPDSWKAS